MMLNADEKKTIVLTKKKEDIREVLKEIISLPVEEFKNPIANNMLELLTIFYVSNQARAIVEVDSLRARTKVLSCELITVQKKMKEAQRVAAATQTNFEKAVEGQARAQDEVAELREDLIKVQDLLGNERDQAQINNVKLDELLKVVMAVQNAEEKLVKRSVGRRKPLLEDLVAFQAAIRKAVVNFYVQDSRENLSEDNVKMRNTIAGTGG